MITEKYQEYSPERHTAPLLLETMALIDIKRTTETIVLHMMGKKNKIFPS